MTEIVMASARRSAAETAHIIAGIAAKAFAGIRTMMAHRRTVAQLRALDDRTLHDVGLHRSEIDSLALGRGSDRFRGRY